MGLDDALGGIQAAIDKSSAASRAHLNYRQGDNYGTGMPSTKIPVPEQFDPSMVNIPVDSAEAFGKFQKWHGAFGNAINSALGPAVMAAVGVPAAALLGQGVETKRESNPFNPADDENHSLNRPSDSFTTTSNVDRLLDLDLNMDMEGQRGFKRLAQKLGTEDGAGEGFLRAMGDHLMSELPSLRQYRDSAQDPYSSLKVVSMLSAQIEFADEWATFSFEGKAAPKILAEWHKLVTTGEGNSDMAAYGGIQFAKAIEWIQHPELLISPTVALSYMNLDNDEAEVGLKVVQWQELPIKQMTDGQIEARITALEHMHPSSLIEPLVDNVRWLMDEAVGSATGDLEGYIRDWRGSDVEPKSLDDVSHIAGLTRNAPSTPQMRRAVEMVARETGRMDEVPVTPEEINAMTAGIMQSETLELPGAFSDLVMGKTIPKLEALRGIDADTDFTRFRDRPRNIRMERSYEVPEETMVVTVESATDGSFKVMSEEGAPILRNRAVGFLKHNGRFPMVPRKPKPVKSVKDQFDQAGLQDRQGAMFAIDIEGDHPAFGEGPQLTISVGHGSEQERDLFERVTNSVRSSHLAAEPRSMTPHEAFVEVDGVVAHRSQQAIVFDFDTVADLHRILGSLAEEESLTDSIADGQLILQAYVNSAMDQPPGTVQQWETFSRDSKGRVAALLSNDGLDSRTDQVPHYRLPAQAVTGETQSSTGGLLLLDESEAWGEGETIHIFIPEHQSPNPPVGSHDDEDMEGFDPERVVKATRKPNGNIVLSLASENGKVETMLAKQAHELMRNLGRKSISLEGS